jgi:hypothetical protein
MTLQEFSIEFDLLYNNISSNQAPGLTEYEKSVFLTQAQEALILDLYKGSTGDSFETTEEVTRYLNGLIKTYYHDMPIVVENSTKNIKEFIFDLNSPLPAMPKLTDLWFIISQEAVIYITLGNPKEVIVIPSKHDTFLKDIKNPFKGPNNNKVLSLTEGETIHIYSKYNVSSITITYLSRPNPIILEDLEDLTINGLSNSKECELPESLHTQILLRAVQMAKAVWAA